jgi:PAS domain S-box-containing protein
MTGAASASLEGGRRLLGALDGFVLLLDRELRLVGASDEAREALGDGATLLGRSCYEVTGRGRQVCPGCPARAALESGARSFGEERVDGGNPPRRLAVVASPLREADGSISGVVVSETRRPLAELRQELAERSEACSTLFEEVPCYVSVQDRSFQVVHANRRFREDFGGHPRGAPVHCYEVYKHRQEPCLNCPVAATFHDGVSHSSEEVVTKQSGEPADVLVVTAPLRDATGEVAYVMKMSTNITEIRKMRSQLEALGLLVGRIAHEIKGVLMGLDGGVYMVSTAMERDDPKRLHEGWGMVRRNVDRVRTLVLDMLYYAKDRKPSYRLASPIRVAEEALRRFEPKARECGLSVETRFDPTAIRFSADARAIEALLTNLLENALDACRSEPNRERHTIRLSVRDEGEEVVYQVADDGVGMDRQARENAFTAFFSSKGSAGTGLGLYIAERITTQHRGRIEVESSLGEGSTFTVRIPKGKRPDRSARPAVGS